jgi:small subunit ribosomal protein S13
MAEPDKEDTEKGALGEKAPQPKKEKKGKEPAGPKEPKKEKSKVEREKLRLAGTDIDGNRSVLCALTDIRGIGTRTAHVITELAQVSKLEKIGNLPESKTEEIENLIKEMHDSVPSWIMNRRKDLDTGDNIHITGHEVEILRMNDINRLKMIRCYRGIRHERGQKVRGQRTRSNGRSGLTVGVVKKAARAQLKEKAKAEKEK